jgi:hypothetical protein
MLTVTPFNRGSAINISDHHATPADGPVSIYDRRAYVGLNPGAT